jgi:hypothetical protein
VQIHKIPLRTQPSAQLRALNIQNTPTTRTIHGGQLVAGLNDAHEIAKPSDAAI